MTRLERCEFSGSRQIKPREVCKHGREENKHIKYRILRESVSVQIADEVVTIIAGLAATEVDGVASMAGILPMSW